MLICAKRAKHHRILHKGHYTLTRENERLIFRTPRGRELPHTGPFHEIPAAERGFPDFPNKPWPHLHPGEYFTTRNNLECSIELVLGV